jgi:alpha-L-fucosidase
MVRAAGYGANFLLNTGPMPNGKIQPENVDTLMAIGHWLETYGETLYGTRKGAVKPQDWGAINTKGNTVFVHVLDPGEGAIEIEGYLPKIKSAKFFDDGSKVEVKVKKGMSGLVLSIPADKIKPIDTIIVLTLR